jgi:hypothetical protein
MAHFARINNDNIVIEVIVAEQDFINSGAVGDPSKWIQTSYNTSRGTHRLGGTPLRKNFAGPGFTYDSVRDAFYPSQPYSSWTLNESTCQWEPPIAVPAYHDDYVYVWNESTLSWDQNPR